MVVPPKLADLGERKIVERLQSRYEDRRHHIGDDCAVVYENSGSFVLATTDPAPKPVCAEFGFDDLYYWGWLLAAINLSDLNAAGATPAGFLSSLTLPSDLPLTKFDRLLDGIDQACRAVGTQVIGGNLKEDPTGRITCEGTALGVSEGQPLGRRGAAPGDVMLALGNTGYFWSALELVRRGLPCDEELLAHFLTPAPLSPIGQLVREGGYSTVAADASDGLYAAVASLTVSNGLGAELVVESWHLPEIVLFTARRLRIDAWRLALGFGDLQFVTAVSADKVPRVEQVAKGRGLHVVNLGVVTEGPGITALWKGKSSKMANFDNERFTTTSQFTQGVAKYSDMLLSKPLFDCGD